MLLGDDIVAVEAYDGTVNVLFRSAVIASSENALVARDRAGATFHFLPFRDVHFALLERRDSPGGSQVSTTTTYWDVVAVGERIPAAVMVFEDPPAGRRELVAHATFLSDRLDIDITPAAAKAERVEGWPR